MGGNNVVGRRLSKPRTNNSTTSLRLSWSDAPADVSSSPIASSDMDYFGDQVTTISSQGERRSRRKSRNKLRAYLYGSSSHESSQSLSSDEDDERHSSLVDAARGARKRLSRTGSSIMQLSAAKGSTSYLTSASTPNLLPSNPEEATHVAEQIKERARLDRIAAQNHVSSPVDEDKHVDSVMAPLRRKSLYTPGIATRHASDILRKPPPPQSIQSQADRDYYYNPAYPSTSPLAQLAAMKNGDNGRETPTQDVTHLGGLQLGTLRVTNGAASPAPPSTLSIHHHQRTDSDLNSPDIFQTASEGSDTDEGLTLKPLQPQHLVTKSSSSTFDLYTPTNQGIADWKESGQEVYSKRMSFPFQPDPSDRASRMAEEYAAEFGGFPFTNAEQPPPEDSTPPDSRPFSYAPTPSPIATGFPASHDDSVGMALSPTEGIQMHPWTSATEEAEPRLTSGTREAAFSKLNGSSNTSRHSLPPQAAINCDSAYNSRASLPFGQHNTTTAPKTDSGYSSRASLGIGQYRKLTGEPSLEVKPPRNSPQSRLASGIREVPAVRSNEDAAHAIADAPPQVRPSFTVIPQHALAKAEPSVTSSSALQLINSARASARSPSQILVKRLQKARPKSQPPPPVNTITVQGYRDLEQVHIPRVPSLIAAKHAERLVQFPVLDHTFPSSDHVSVSRQTSLTRPYDVSVRFPSPANALESTGFGRTSAPYQPESTTISPSGDQNRIADEVGEWSPSTIVNSPSWSAFGGNKQKKLQKKAVKERQEAEKKQAKEEKELERKLAKERKDHEKQKRRSESKERLGRSRRTSWYRGKSSERRSGERDTEAIISDFGTVAESLGGSPYDIARSMQTSSNDSQQASWHPYQISNTIRRPRSMAPADTPADAAATLYAPGRLRSQSIGRPATPASEMHGFDDGIRGRTTHARPQTMYADVPPVPALPAVDLRLYGRDWAQSRQRSQSVSRTQESMQQHSAFNFCEDVVEPPARPQSIAVEAPPLPALPYSTQEDRPERRISESGSQSMIAGSPVSPITRPQSLVFNSPAYDNEPVKEVSMSAAATPLPLRATEQQDAQRTSSRPQSLIVGSSPSLGSDSPSARQRFPADGSDSPQQLSVSAGYDDSAPLRKAKISRMAVPDLWTSGSLEKKSPKETVSLKQPDRMSGSAVQDDYQNTSSCEWGPQQQAWRERRKSAGEALFSQNHMRKTSDSEGPIATTGLVRKPRPESTMSRSAAANPTLFTPTTSSPVSSPLAASTTDAVSPRPLREPVTQEPGSQLCEDPKWVFPTPAERRRDQSRSNVIPRKRIASGTTTPRGASAHRSSVMASNTTRPISTTFDADVPTTSIQLMQRYGGGLLYGYEPGQGLGGSAGTRGAQTLASRKSVELSKGYGIDLSDIPVFVMPATH